MSFIDQEAQRYIAILCCVNEYRLEHAYTLASPNTRYVCRENVIRIAPVDETEWTRSCIGKSRL